MHDPERSLRRRIGRTATRFALVLAACAAAVLAALPAQAQIGSERYASIIVEARSGRVISAVSPDEQRHPASLTKMMTLYMVFEALRDRRITLRQNVAVSAHAASQSPTKLGLVPGARLTVEEAILGLVTKSANDAAAAIGEMLGGDERRFAQMMTLRARALGMTRTTFRNASGLPDLEQVTTARDMALLGRRLIQDFPAEYRYFATPSFRFRGRVFFNHDRMLESYPGTDGIKTGYIDASGFNLVSSTVRGNVRLVGVVMGAARAWERDAHMISLLDQGFEKLEVPLAPREAPSPRLAPLVSAAGAAAAVKARQQASRWSVQVGAFATQAAAKQAATNARRLTDAGEARVEPVVLKGKTTWRAQVIGLTQPEASLTCAQMARRKMACTLLRPEAGQVASR